MQAGGQDSGYMSALGRARLRAHACGPGAAGAGERGRLGGRCAGSAARRGNPRGIGARLTDEARGGTGRPDVLALVRRAQVHLQGLCRLCERVRIEQRRKTGETGGSEMCSESRVL